MQRDTIATFLDNFRDPSLENANDAELLNLVVNDNDEAAYRQLVQRHGPMVLGVCRRVLFYRQDVEDAFQATFLVLVRKASSLAKRELLGNWLYGVATRTAMEARKKAVVRSHKEREAAAMKSAAVVDDNSWQDVQPLLDQEMCRLSNKYRKAIVLCDVQGVPRREAAQMLGVAEGTLSSRLARAREQLRSRLQRRGVTLTSAVLVAGLTSSASADVPTDLVTLAVDNFSRLASAHPLSTNALTLADGVSRSMVYSRIKTTVLVSTLALVALAGGVGWLWRTYGNASPAPVRAAGDNKQQRAKNAPIALPDDKTKPVITYDVEGGFFRRKQKKPYLSIFADGRVIARDPRVADKVAKSTLSAKQLQALLQFIVREQEFFKITSGSLKKAVQGKQPGRRLLGPEVDATAPVVRVNTAKKTHQVKLYALEPYAKKYPQLKKVNRFYAVTKRLAFERFVAFLGGYDKLRTALDAANKELKKRRPKSPPMREQDLRASAVNKNGSVSALFQRNGPKGTYVIATVNLRPANITVMIKSNK